MITQHNFNFRDNNNFKIISIFFMKRKMLFVDFLILTKEKLQNILLFPYFWID